MQENSTLLSMPICLVKEPPTERAPTRTGFPILGRVFSASIVSAVDASQEKHPHTHKHKLQRRIARFVHMQTTGFAGCINSSTSENKGARTGVNRGWLACG